MIGLLLNLKQVTILCFIRICKSVSLLPLTAFDINTNGAINFLKIRGSYGSSARFADAYNTRDVLNIGTHNIWLNNSNGNSVINTNSVSNTIGNPDLKPELQTEIEFGLKVNS